MIHAPRTLFAALVLAALAAPAAAFETKAGAAWVYDLTTHTVLLDKNAHVPLPPASMSKLMTVNLLFEALRDGRVTMDTRFHVSERAKSMGGSTMFLNTTDTPSVAELIQGIIVLSGNDACVVVAEGLAGTEEAFAELMNRRAAEIGLADSHFANASGWPDPAQRMSMHDLGRLAIRLIEEFPDLYHYFGEKEFAYDNRAPQNRHNRNPLLKLNIGADGLKTGHTEEAGFGLVGSAKQGERRIVFVVSGLGSDTDRASESAAIANWAFRGFMMKTAIKAGTPVAEVPVWLGAGPSVRLVPQTDVEMLVPVAAASSMTAEAVFKGPVAAPVAAGQPLGELVITVPGEGAGAGERRVPLVAAEAVAAGGFQIRAKAAFARLTEKALSAAGS